jgi:hypothetical protein
LSNTIVVAVAKPWHRRLPSRLVSFRPEALRGVPPSGPPAGGEISYRLARNAVVNEFHRGRLGRGEVCDAHPELLRAARNVGESTSEPCPICEDTSVVFVSYVFGPGLPPSGRCVTSRSEMAKLNRRSGVLACYVVEVCPECSWNHLAQIFPVGGRRPR